MAPLSGPHSGERALLIREHRGSYVSLELSTLVNGFLFHPRNITTELSLGHRNQEIHLPSGLYGQLECFQKPQHMFTSLSNDRKPEKPFNAKTVEGVSQH